MRIAFVHQVQSALGAGTMKNGAGSYVSYIGDRGRRNQNLGLVRVLHWGSLPLSPKSRARTSPTLGIVAAVIKISGSYVSYIGDRRRSHKKFRARSCPTSGDPWPLSSKSLWRSANLLNVTADGVCWPARRQQHRPVAMPHAIFETSDRTCLHGVLDRAIHESNLRDIVGLA